MVSLSGVRVIRRKRDLLLHLRLHQFHRPSDGTSGELGFMRPRSSFSLYTNSYKMSRVICLIRVKQIMFCFICRKYERHTSLLSWHDEPPVWPCKAVNLQCPKGAPKAQGLTANAVPSDNRLAMKRLHVSRSGMRSGLLLVAPTKACSINPHAVENHGDLASHRNLGALHAPPLGNSQTPSLEC
jgi:hypothetical protein